MQSPSQEYKYAQRNFYSWVTKWTQCGTIENTCVPDIPEIISLLQAIGYKVKYFDPAVNPDDILPLKGGGGIRMMITCTHSGLRACLEAPSECHCPNSNNASFWEVTGSAPNTGPDVIEETGSDIILPVSKGNQHVISQVINHLFNMISNSRNDHNQNDKKTPAFQTGTPFKPILHGVNQTNESFSSCVSTTNVNNITSATNTPMATNISVVPKIKIESPKLPMSPARYRSLDTLTSGSGNDEELPEPGELKRDKSPCKESLTAIMNSSPNISGELSHPSSTSSPNRSVPFDQNAFMKVKMAQDLLQEVIDFMENQKCAMTSLEDISKIKASTESLASTSTKPIEKKSTKVPIPSKLKPTRFASSPNLTRTTKPTASIFSRSKVQPAPQIKPTCRPPIRSCSSTSSIQSNPITSKQISDNKKLDVHKPAARRCISVSEATSSGLKGLPMMKKKLFANVKSTIPKPDYRK